MKFDIALSAVTRSSQEAATIPGTPHPPRVSSDACADVDGLGYGSQGFDALEAFGQAVNGATAARMLWCVDLEGVLVAMTTIELWTAFERGQLSFDVKVWREGMEAWDSAHQVPELACALRSLGTQAEFDLGSPTLGSSRQDLPRQSHVRVIAGGQAHTMSKPSLRRSLALLCALAVTTVTLLPAGAGDSTRRSEQELSAAHGGPAHSTEKGQYRRRATSRGPRPEARIVLARE